MFHILCFNLKVSPVMAPSKQKKKKLNIKTRDLDSKNRKQIKLAVQSELMNQWQSIVLLCACMQSICMNTMSCTNTSPHTKHWDSGFSFSDFKTAKLTQHNAAQTNPDLPIQFKRNCMCLHKQELPVPCPPDPHTHTHPHLVAHNTEAGPAII